jgi:3',5'-cyclic-AMP phosphodiesterase
MNEVLRLLQFSDPHLFAHIDGEIKGVRSYDSLQQVLAHARARHWGAEALLLTGDLVHDEPGGYQHIREVFGSLGKPVYCLPGNHDDVPALNAALQGAPFQVGGHADLHNWRLIFLDSVVPGKAHGELSPAELARLDGALASAGDRHVLICLHHHPVHLASRWLDEVKLLNSGDFFAITDRSPAVRAICWGHVHQQFDVRRKGVRLLAVPSTCAQFSPYSEQFALDSAPPGYRRLALHPDGHVETEVVRVELNSVSLRAAG